MLAVEDLGCLSGTQSSVVACRTVVVSPFTPVIHDLLVHAFDTLCNERNSMIDREHERVIPLREVPKYVPSRIPGRRVSPATVCRWAQRRGNPLETFCTPGGRFTSIEAIDRFI